MKILTFDTSLNKTYITYGEDNKIIENKIIESSTEKYHSAYLIPEIVNIFKKHNIGMSEIDVIGINEGPGSFTGIRICTVIARVAAQQTNAKVIPVPSLEILAKVNNTDKPTLVLLDARKNKVYCAVYDKNGQQIIAPHSACKDNLFDMINSDDYKIVTDLSISNFLIEKNIKSVCYESSEYELGKYLYEISLKKMQNNIDDFFWAKAKPLYIQPPSITISKKQEFRCSILSK